ncbi:MAG: hypothetical protein D6780_03530, partial [Candidatus Dadabacteria bacterium]
LSLAEKMTSKDLSTLFTQSPSLTRYPSQKWNKKFIKHFGEEGKEAFYVVQQGNYTATFYTGKSYGSTTKGGGGGVLGAFGVRVADISDMPITIIPLKGGYVGDFRNTVEGYDPATGVYEGYGYLMNSQRANCVKDNGERKRSKPENWSCNYLLGGGTYDWASWPSQQIIGIPAELNSDMPVVTDEKVYDSFYYDVTFQHYTKSEGDNVPTLILSKPLKKTRYYMSRSPDPSNPCEELTADGGCITRKYKFYRNKIKVSTEVNLNPNTSMRALYDALPVFFYAGRLSDGPGRPTYDTEVFEREIVSYCDGNSWFKGNLDNRSVSNITQIKILNALQRDGITYYGGVLVQFHSPVTIRTARFPVWHNQVSREGAMFNKNILLKLEP